MHSKEFELIDGRVVRQTPSGRYQDKRTGKWLTKKVALEMRIVKSGDEDKTDKQPLSPRDYVFQAMQQAAREHGYPVESLEEAWGKVMQVQAEIAQSERSYPTPYDPIDPASIPARRWIYGQHYIRSNVSVLASAGGVGKTSMQIVEALAICTGRPLLGETVHEPCNVWIINLEDPLEEDTLRDEGGPPAHPRPWPWPGAGTPSSPRPSSAVTKW